MPHYNKGQFQEPNIWEFHENLDSNYLFIFNFNQHESKIIIQD